MTSSSPISINDDLILEILSRLPSKSIARFRCLSKQWASMLSRKRYASGLFYLHGCGSQRRPLISNPITGRYAILPYLYSYRNLYVFFGFDPIDMQYKALRMAYPWDPNRHKTLTFGDGDMKWRKVKGSLRHEIKSEGICINGVLYYLGYTPNCFNDDHVVTSAWIIVCFDLRSEKITCIDVNRFGKLINYKGKLALIYLGKDSAAINELHMWVLDDVEKHEWSKHAYTLTHDKLFRRHFRIAGATTWGEIVFSMHKYTPNKPFYVFYFNPEKNTLKRVEIKGFGEYSCTVFTFVNHVEDLDVNDLKLLKSTHPPLTEPNYAEECAPDSDSD
ncbi:PREDICTED: F-box protein At2g15640-like [Camelina sativa]|uniref:F-box protein At2g15640-like n=1 Tax=Camelina sativa TaxID=90675 RepID=A0ABM1QF63_CAMSA|nr:PREDICTED: F-box protein At2g15640-like [Camelina sativa]